MTIKIDHKPVCDGTLRCRKCGRRGCKGCINGFFEDDINPELHGLCPICSGLYTTDTISLFDIEQKEWDT